MARHVVHCCPHCGGRLPPAHWSNGSARHIISLARTHPDWSWERIARDAGVTRQWVHQVLDVARETDTLQADLA